MQTTKAECYAVVRIFLQPWLWYLKPPASIEAYRPVRRLVGLTLIADVCAFAFAGTVKFVSR